MDSTNVCGGVRCCDVDADIANLTVESRSVDVVLIVVAIRPLATDVHIRGQDTETNKAWGGLEDRPGIRIANDLRANEHCDAAGNEICAWWEVYDGGLGRGAVALCSATLTVGDGFLDGGS